MTGKDQYGLTRDRIGALCMYTMEGVYRILNQRLRIEDRTALVKFWFLYLKLLLVALFKLPDVKMTVYRGVNPPHIIAGEYEKIGR